MRVWWLLCLFWLAGFAQAQPTVDVACLPGSADWSLQQMQQTGDGGWKHGTAKQPFAFGLKHEWCRLMASDPGNDGLMIEFDGQAVISVAVPTVYLPSEGGKSRRISRLEPNSGSFASRRAPTLRVPEVDENQPIYVRFTGVRPPDTVKIKALTLDKFFHVDRRAYGFNVAIITGMAMLGLMAAIFAFQLGRVALVYLCIWVAAVLLLRLIESGILFDWVPMGLALRRLLQSVAITTAVVASTVFAILYLKMREHYPRWVHALTILMIVMVLLSLTLNIAYSGMLRASLNLTILMQFLIMIVAASHLAWKGDASARFFLVGWAPVLFMSIVRVMDLMLDVDWPWVEPLWQITLLTAVFTLLVAASRAARYAEREMHIARQAANLDALTGLLNRSALHRELAREITLSRNLFRPLSVLFLDLDHFKAINDRHGHDVGDECLRHFAQVMQARLRASDVLARLGGEEFVALMPGTDLQQARHLAEELRAALSSSPLIQQMCEVGMTMSVGVAMLRETDDVEKLLKRADVAVYAAKDAGRDCVVLEAPA